MSTAILYFAAAAATLWLAHRFISALSWRAALALLLLPLCFTGGALLTGKVYAPIDIPLTTEPFKYMSGVTEAHNPMLSDVYSLNIPWKYAVRVAYSRGELPLWSPYVFGGDILAAAAQPTPYEPYFLLSLLLPMANSLTYLAAITFFLAGLCMYLYARDLECGELASIFGAVSWMFGSMIVFWLEWVITASLLWLPLVFLGVRRVIRSSGADERVRSSNGVGILTAAFVMMLLMGHPETALHVVFVGVFYALFELGSLFGWRPRSLPYRRIGAIAMRGIGAGLLALAITAIYLLPIIEALPQTFEHFFRETFVALQDPSVPWEQGRAQIVRNFIPFRYGYPMVHATNSPVFPLPDNSYAGSIALALASFGLWKTNWHGRWFFLALAIFGYLAGAESFLVADMLSALPLFHIALNKRLIFCALFAGAVLGALGVEALVRGGRRSAAALMLLLAVTLGAGVALSWSSMMAGGLKPAFVQVETARLLLPLLIGAIVLWFARSHRAAAAALIALLLLQRTAEMGDFYPTLPARDFYPPVPEFALLEKSAEPYRVVGHSYMLPPNTATMYQLQDVRGYQAMTSRRLFDTFSIWSIVQPVWFNRVTDLTRPFLSMMNVRYAFASPGTPVPEGWSLVSTSERMTLLENRRVLPRAYVPNRVHINYSHPVVIAEMRSQRDFREVSWIEHPTGGAPPGDIPNGPGYATTTAPKLGTRIIDVRLLNPGWVVVTEAAWKGWKAYVGGRRIQLRFANHAFLGLYLPAGRHQVRLIYRPRSFDIGAAISGVTILALIAAGVLRARRSRKTAPSG